MFIRPRLPMITTWFPYTPGYHSLSKLVGVACFKMAGRPVPGYMSPGGYPPPPQYMNTRSGMMVRLLLLIELSVTIFR